MSENHPTAPADPVKTAKPAKPYPDFPLFAHAAGVWAKKIRGKMHYFGPWADPDGALKKYLEQKDALHAGKKPREDTGATTVKEAANHFLNAKQSRVDSGELSPRTWAVYKEAADAAVSAFGKSRLVADLDPDDFARLRTRLAKRLGPHGLGSRIQSVRSLFKHALDAGLIDRPVRFGADFGRPSKKTLRLHRAQQGPKLLTVAEICRLIDAATLQHRAMLLLGINCGFGNADCGGLPLRALDLDGGWIDFPRPKTGINRRCPLWPETVAALRAVLAARKEPKDKTNAELVFITRTGQPWAKDTAENPLSDMSAKLLKKLGINGRKGLGFYTLRHTFRTVADEARDQPAADFIMGHEIPHMSSVYRETISDARLKAVADHVRAWLFPTKATADLPPAAPGR
jgi:integrase